MLDDQEDLTPGSRPSSEFLVPLYLSRFPDGSRYRSATAFIRAFALAAGTLWRPVHPTVDELTLAQRFRDKSIRAEVRAANADLRRKRSELDPGEAESAAIAVSRGWTFLTDDQAAVDVVRSLYPNVPVLRTSGMLVYAAQQGFIDCEEVADLFNLQIKGDLGFYASRKTVSGGREHLFLRCDPPREVWELE